MNSHIEIPAIKAALLFRRDELIPHLFPHRKISRHHDGLRVGTYGSLAISREGLFHDKETDEGGDIINLIQYALRCDFKTALDWCRGFLGSVPVTTPKAEYKAMQKKDPVLRELERMDKALQKWRQAIPAQGTIAEMYLVNRAITVPPPVSIRFLPRAWNYTSGAFHPALVAAIQNIERKVIGVQVIYLTDTGHKISGEGVIPKLTYGIAKSGAVRLGPLKSSLIVTEGIEDGLTILQSCPNACVWACLGTSGLIGVSVPADVSSIVIGSDNDKAGIAAARRLAERLMKEGKQVKIALPRNGKDFNEMLKDKTYAIA